MAESVELAAATNAAIGPARNLNYELRHLAKGLVMVHAPMAYLAMDAAKGFSGMNILRGAAGKGGLLGGFSSMALAGAGAIGAAGAVGVGGGVYLAKQLAEARAIDQKGVPDAATVEADLRKWREQQSSAQRALQLMNARGANADQSKELERLTTEMAGISQRAANLRNEIASNQLVASMKAPFGMSPEDIAGFEMARGLAEQRAKQAAKELQQAEQLILAKQAEKDAVLKVAEAAKAEAEARLKSAKDAMAATVMAQTGLPSRDSRLQDMRLQFVMSALGLPSQEQAAAARAAKEAADRAEAERRAGQLKAASGAVLPSIENRLDEMRARFIAGASGLPMAAAGGLVDLAKRAKDNAAQEAASAARVRTTDPMGFARMLQESLGGETKKQTELLKAIKENTAKDGAAKVGAPKGNKGKV